MPLPDAYRWSDSADGSSHLYWNYGFVASIAADGSTKIKLWDKREIHAKAGSTAQAKRFIERWILAQRSERAYECARWRARYSRRAPVSPPRKAIDPILFARPGRSPTAGNGLSSKVIKMRYDEDEFFY